MFGIGEIATSVVIGLILFFSGSGTFAWARKKILGKDHSLVKKSEAENSKKRMLAIWKDVLGAKKEADKTLRHAKKLLR